MAYATGAYTVFSSLPAPPRPMLGASRKVDFARRCYVLDETTGGPEYMPALAQLACLAVAYGVPDARAITPQQQSATRQAILAALAPYAAQMPGLEVTVERASAGAERRSVRYRDASTGLNIEVQLP